MQFPTPSLLSVLAFSAAFGILAACGGTTVITSGNSADAGTITGDDSGTISGDDAGYDTPSVCTSGTTWTRGDRGSASMHPGVACIACHEQRNAPTFIVAGTVFPTAHEPDDCNGVAGSGTTVVITDANGKTTSLTVNSVGNFYSQGSITPPFSAKVVKNGQERAMSAMQTSGDCNSCHTETGASAAPGRIMAP